MAQKRKKSDPKAKKTRPAVGGARKPAKPAPKKAVERFASVDPMLLIRRVLTGCDQFLLSRQVSYSVQMSEALSRVWVDEREAQKAIDALLKHLVMRSPRKGSLSVGVKKFALQSGDGVEFSFDALDRFLREADQKSYMASLFDGGNDHESGVSLGALRESVMHQHGRLWADVPAGNRVGFHLVFPSTKEVVHRALAGQRAFRYDISITNYPLIRKRFGILKGRHLVEQIENYVKSLVRYPIDGVTASPEKGLVTTIYETQPGSAESVSARISKRLGQERFNIGKRPVEINFSYELTSLARPRAVSTGVKKRSD